LLAQEEVNMGVEDQAREDARAAVRRVVEALNRAWMEGRGDAVRNLLRDDVVFVQPGFGARVEGAAACVRTYVEFTKAAEVQGFAPAEMSIDLFGSTAMVSYRFGIHYVVGGQEYRESGRELLVLTATAGGWKVAWRTLLLDPPAAT
jgi:ketosteroid isomerase-like protein